MKTKEDYSTAEQFVYNELTMEAIDELIQTESDRDPNRMSLEDRYEMAIDLTADWYRRRNQ